MFAHSLTMAFLFPSNLHHHLLLLLLLLLLLFLFLAVPQQPTIYLIMLAGAPRRGRGSSGRRSAGSAGAGGRQADFLIAKTSVHPSHLHNIPQETTRVAAEAHQRGVQQCTGLVWKFVCVALPVRPRRVGRRNAVHCTPWPRIQLVGSYYM